MLKFINKFTYTISDNSSYKKLCNEANKLYNKNIKLKNINQILKNENIKLQNIINKKSNN